MPNQEQTIYVTKRNGQREPFDAEKIHQMLNLAAEDLSGVSISDVLMRSHHQFYDGMTTEEINQITVGDCENLISPETPNYQYMASKLILSDLRKKVFGSYEPRRLYDVVKDNVAAGVYEPLLLEWYTEDEWVKLGAYLKHERDFKLTAAGIKQAMEKFLIQDRSTKTYYETPQVAFMVMSAIGFHKYPANQRLKLVKEFYDAVSKFQISLPTPILGGLRSRTKQFSSCVLIDVGDSIDSLTDAAKTITKYASKRAGIGINGGRIRAQGSKVNQGEIVHTGVTPFYRMFESAIKSCSAGGIRDCSATLYAPIWHAEIETIMSLKSNKSTHENAVRRLDYGIQWDTYLLRRARNNEDMTLFSPHDVPELYDAYFGRDRAAFEKLYEKLERTAGIKGKKVSARKLLETFLRESLETGRLYMFMADHVNTHSPFTKPIFMSNLCAEIALPTEPIVNKTTTSLGQDEQGSITFEGLVQLCTLSAINLGNLDLDDPTDMQRRMYLIVRFLNEVLDYQEYVVPQARRATMRYRPLGIGVVNYAYFLAKNRVKYHDNESHYLTHQLAEQLHYYALEASVDLAAERGAITGLEDTIYAEGKLLIDSYNKSVDMIVKPSAMKLDWEALRAKVKTHGVYNATLLALMPAESSSYTTNSTNGIEPIRSLLVKKSSKKSKFIQLVPEARALKNEYTYLWDMTPEMYNGYIRNMAVFQKFVCQSISSNLSYNPEHFAKEGEAEAKISLSALMNHVFLMAKLGVKTRYYLQTKGEKDHSETLQASAEPTTENEGEACEGGACKL